MARDPLLQAALLAALGLLPIVFVTTTCFARFAIVLAGLRLALGTQNLPPNSVTFSLALVLSLAVMAPVAGQMHHEFIAATDDTPLDQLSLDRLARATAAAAGPWLRFLELNSGDRERQAISELRAAGSRADAAAARGGDGGEDPALDDADADAATDFVADDAITHAAAFALTELNRAFELIFLLFLPFVLIDLIAGAILMSLGMHMLSPAAVSLPFKLLLFAGTDGWTTLTAQLLSSYTYPPAL